MQAVALRRLIVFGVCLLGVGGLYLVPSMAGSPDQIAGSDRRSLQPTGRPTTRVSTVASARVQPTATPVTTDASSPEADEPEPDVTLTKTKPAESPSSTPTSAKRRAGGTPFDPAKPRDETPPGPVRAIELRSATTDEATFSWPAADDDTGVVGYRVWLNYFDVGTTSGTEITVPWFRDDAAKQIVQVRALDAAGNQSETAATLVVTRPTPTPVPSPTPTPATTPTPTPSDSATPTASTTPPPPTVENASATPVPGGGGS